MKIEDIKYNIPNHTVSEDDFDIEKWRVENPMDYLKAMYLINTAINKDEVFKSIYEVTRLYIPHTLYKYFSLTDNMRLNEQKLETLQQEKLFVASPNDLNDPFENKAYFYMPNALKKYDRLADYDGKLIDDFSSFIRLTALTSNNVNSMPMWAHYANNHTGFCVSYDMPNNAQLSGCTFPVQYTDQRIDITSLMDQQAHKIFYEIKSQSTEGKKQILLDDLSLIYLTSFFCNIKHLSWSYEKEFRCTIAAKAKGVPYVMASPKEIFIGMNCPSTYADRILKIAHSMQVPIYKMAFDEFGPDYNLISTPLL